MRLALDANATFRDTSGLTGNDAEGDVTQPLIRTPDHRVRVFISSTMGELAPERAAVAEVIKRLRLSPVLFELGARPHPPRALYRAYLEQSHIFVGLYWERYGWVAPDMGISGLEDEYRLVGDQAVLLYRKEPSPQREPRLTAIIDEMQALPTPPKTFTTPEELAELVANDLALLLSARFAGAHPAEAAPAGQPEPRRSAPPLPPTPLIGRDSEVADTIDLLLRDDVRLVTLSGPGGIGKSRLAVEIATRLETVFTGGVVFARLGSLTDPGLLLSTIAAAAGMHTEGTRSVFDALVEELSAKPTLLVLDNFEHLLTAAPVVTQLLEACSTLRVLVTSRAVLRLHGEWERPVPPLPADDAIALFTDRATEARAGRPLTAADRDAIAEICRRLDGLPLAIELAAARSRLLPPAALLARLGNRLDMLTGGPADLPQRQQTLRSTIDWSYDLLEPEERLLFARLSVFRGGWTLEAAEEICTGDGVDDVLGTMSILLERSLISVADTASESPRFRMLAVLSDYARERLADHEATDQMAMRHAAYALKIAEDAEPHLRGPRARHFDAVLEQDMDNFRAAVDWLLAHDVPRAVDLVWALSIHLWTADHLVESRRWLEAAVAHRDALDARQRARLDFLVGATAYEQGDYEHARTFLTQALEGFRATGDRREQGSALTMLGATYPHFGQDDRAARCLHDALEILREIDEWWSIAFALNLLTALVGRDDLDAAMVTAAEALDISERIGAKPLASHALMHLAYLALLRGDDTAKARDLLERSITMSMELRFREVLAYCLDTAAAIALHERAPERAAVLLGGSDALRESIGAHVWPLLRAARDAIADAVRRRLGDEAYARAREGGRTVPHPQLVDLALSATAPVASVS